jgi:hypothetical protein
VPGEDGMKDRKAKSSSPVPTTDLNTARKKNTEGLRPPWKPGESGNPKGRVPLQRREGDNRHTVLDAAHEIATMKAGEKLSPKQLEGKTRLWVMLYQMSIKDPRTFLGYYAGQPRQAVDLADVTPGSVAYHVVYDDDGLRGVHNSSPEADNKATGNHKSSGKAKDS